MSKFKNYEKLIGVTAEGDATEIENNTESVAEYIISRGIFLWASFTQVLASDLFSYRNSTKPKVKSD